MNHNQLNQSASDQEENLQARLADAPETLMPKAQFDDLNTFETKISHAKIMGEPWVETSPEIINYFNRNGLGKNPAGEPINHFIYKGILVCEFGQKEEATRKMNEQMGRKVHGPGEGVIMTGQAHLTK